MATSIFTSQTPASTNINDGVPYTLGTAFYVTTAGYITAIRWYFPATLPSGTVTGYLWAAGGDTAGTATLLASKAFSSPVAGAWNVATLDTPIAVSINTPYLVGVYTPDRYVSTGSFFTSALTNSPVVSPQDSTSVGGTTVRNGKYRQVAGFGYPESTFGAACYFADVVWEETVGPPEPNGRLYLTNDTAPYTPATRRGAWDNTTTTITGKLGLRPVGTAATSARAETSATNNYDVFLGRWISTPALRSGTLSGTMAYAIGAVESSTAANMFMHLHMYVTAGDSDTVRGTLLTDRIGATEWGTTAAGSAETAVAISSVAVQAGDRIVVEVGYRAVQTSTTSYTGTINYGNTGHTDLTSGSTSVTTQPGWVELTSARGIFWDSVGSLSDDFADRSVDTAKWPLQFSVSEATGRGVLPVTSSFSAYRTNLNYGLQESSMHVRVDQVPAASSATSCYLRFYLNASESGTFIAWHYNAVTNQLSAMSAAGFTDGSAVNLTYSSSTHRWWRIRETGGTLYWDTSADGDTWTNRRSAATPAVARWKDSQLQIQAFRDAGTNDDAIIASFNTGPAAPGEGVTVTAAANDPSITALAATNATAESAAGSGVANQPTVTAVSVVTATAQNAAGTGAADGPGRTVAPGVQHATATGTAETPTTLTVVVATAEHAAATASSNQPTVVTGVTATAEHATATATVNQPAVVVSDTIAVAAGNAAGSVVAETPGRLVAVGVAHATAAAAASDPAVVTSTAGIAGVAVGTATADQPTVTASGNALPDTAGGSGAAHPPVLTISGSASPEVAGGSGAAGQPSVQTTGNTNAVAESAGASGAALFDGTASLNLALQAQDAVLASGAADTGSVQIAPGAGAVAAVGVAHEPTPGTSGNTGAPAEYALVVGSAPAGSVTLTTPAGAVGIDGAALGPGLTASGNAAAEHVAVGATANQPTVITGSFVNVEPVTAGASGVAADGSGQIRTGPDAAGASGAALFESGASLSLLLVADEAVLASGVADGPTPTVRTGVQSAESSGSAETPTVLTGSETVAAAGVAGGSGAALFDGDASLNVTLAADDAVTASAAALQPEITVSGGTGVNPLPASGSGDVQDPALRVLVAVEAVLAQALSTDPALRIAVATDWIGASGTAQDPVALSEGLLPGSPGVLSPSASGPGLTVSVVGPGLTATASSSDASLSASGAGLVLSGTGATLTASVSP